MDFYRIQNEGTFKKQRTTEHEKWILKGLEIQEAKQSSIEMIVRS